MHELQRISVTDVIAKDEEIRSKQGVICGSSCIKDLEAKLSIEDLDVE